MMSKVKDIFFFIQLFYLSFVGLSSPLHLPVSDTGRKAEVGIFNFPNSQQTSRTYPLIIKPFIQYSTAAGTEVIPWQSAEVLTGTHDPSIIRDERGVYTLMSTNNLCLLQQSTDMLHWTNKGSIFSAVPSWMKAIYSDISDLWAPHISFRNGRFWVYYCGSSFGSNNSVIGVASSPTLDTGSPQYKWTDHGEVFRSATADNYNAIDPDVLIDNSGRVWLLFGSFWSGIKMIEIDPATGKRLASNTNIYSIASRGGAGIEGPTGIEHNGYYYLFTSWDACCKGINSTYRTMGGRSASPNSGYVDTQNRSLNNNAADELLKSYDRYIGPGGGTVFRDGRRDYYAHHYYNSAENGTPRLQIREIVYNNNWPVVTQPFLGRRLSYEAEHAVLANVTLMNSTNASNKQYVGAINVQNSRARFYLNALAGGEYTLRIHYAAGTSAASHYLKVNSGNPVEVSYPKTTASGQFPQGQAVTVKISLNEGANVLDFTQGSGTAELDRIDLIRSALLKIEGGSSDDGVGASYVSAGNNASITTNGWVMMENIDFSDGGIKMLTLVQTAASDGQVKISLDNANGTINGTFNLDASDKVSNFTLPSAFASATGVHDVFITVLSGNPILDYYQFSKTAGTVDCNNVVNGTATIDACGQCTGGNTGKIPCVVTGLIDDGGSAKGRIFPNPFSTALTMTCVGYCTYTVMNCLGVEVERGEGFNQLAIGSSLYSGVYLLLVKEKDQTIAYKVTKQ